MPQIPSQIADITADWLNEVLPSDIGRVKSFDVQRFGTGVGILGELARLTLTYLDGPGAGPERTVAKCQALLVLFTLLIVAYMLLLEVLGFILSSYLFLLLSMQVLGSRRLLVNLAASAVVLASIYIIFQTAFSVVLPPGSLIGPYLPEFLK